MQNRWLAALAGLASLGGAALLVHGAAADAEPRLISGTDYLRAVSLDLRGVPPTAEEYGLVKPGGAVPDSLLDVWLSSDAFADRAARYHRSLFWNNLEQSSLSANTWYLYEGSNEVLYVRNRAERYGRGYYGECGDFEATFDEAGRPIAMVDGDGLVQEGWVWVTPYWEPSEPVKVCAYDAQTDPVSSNGSLCDTDEGDDDPGCGCGPGLVWCFPTYSIDDVVLASMATDLDLRVRTMIQQDRPYLDLLTDNRAWVNGPMVHWLRYNTYISGGLNLDLAPYPPELLPDLSYTDTEEWVELELGPEQSGIFTSPAFLLRFQTNRGRANRFYNDFLCQTFQTPEGGLELGEEVVMTLDLTERVGCDYCHALLEPAAASWGRWVESGLGYLDMEAFPDYSEACAEDAQTSQSIARDCSRYYKVTPAAAEEQPFVGWLNAFTFLEERHQPHISQGPRLLVEQGIQDGRLSRCVSARAAQNLLGRELTEADEPLLEELSATLEDSDWSFRALTRAIVTSPSYRRLP